MVGGDATKAGGGTRYIAEGRLGSPDPSPASEDDGEDGREPAEEAEMWMLPDRLTWTAGEPPPRRDDCQVVVDAFSPMITQSVCVCEFILKGGHSQYLTVVMMVSHTFI